MRIYCDILSAIQDETKNGKIVLTRIQQSANLPFDRLKQYISELTALGFIQNEPALTEKGAQYLLEYEKVVDFMNRMGLGYKQ